MKNPDEFPTAVHNLRDLCKDILKKSVLYEGERWWCKNASDLYTRQSLGTAYSAPIALMVKREILAKVIVGQSFRVSHGVPKEFFLITENSRGRVTTCIYKVQKEGELKRLAKDSQASAEWLSLPLVDQQPLSFKRALKRVRDEIDSHPDPARFYLSILRRLSPK